MDSVEKNEQGNTPEEKEKAGAQTNKRMRIKDTRKIDYNRTAPASRPYQPVYGQTRQSSNYQSRQYQQHEANDYFQPRKHTNNDDSEGSYHQRRIYDNNQGSGYQQRQGSYQGYNRHDGQQQRSNNQGEGYQQRQNYIRQGGQQQRNYYNQAGGYNQGNYVNRDTGYPQKNQGGRLQQRNNNSRNNKQKPANPKPVKYKEFLLDPAAPIRLNKFLANAGVCSRREADEFIQAGVIRVNDEIVTELGTKITRLDKVMFHDQPIQIESKIYIILNKPKNTVTTSDDPQNRQTVMDLVKNACRERIYPVGRLDRNTTGVLLLTNDGEMAAKLTHPAYKKKKIYHVWLDHEVSIEDMEKLANGIQLEDGEIHADAISYANEEDRTQVGIEIHSGKNRIVRRMFEMLGYHVARLDRVYFAGLTKKNLGRGKWRYLTEQEVNALRMGAYE
jgi:23S rRNA pseudouridine2605 synthase